jgi:hypothetical protein
MRNAASSLESKLTYCWHIGDSLPTGSMAGVFKNQPEMMLPRSRLNLTSMSLRTLSECVPDMSMQPTPIGRSSKSALGERRESVAMTG